jgi:methionyl-tRNA synthetase
MRTYLTVAIPYVNADPHLGYAFELVEADLAARARRQLGQSVRLLGGTDEYSLKNVLAAEAAGESTRAFVDRHADAFAALAQPLAISFDDFIRTSSDPRHRPAVERLWRACAANGDLYQRDYTGRYCVGCEQFYDPDELIDGNCPDHLTPVESITETNWFFRLSAYTARLLELLETRTLDITPEPFRAETIAFVQRGLTDISVSRSIERARGWGIPVPNDPTQVIYVWFDALTNYLSALDYGDAASSLCEQWWRGADERTHIVGKGITRFHAVYWPAFLLSAAESVPTRIHVHPYLTVAGAKLSKSTGARLSPTTLVDDFGTDALRWWIARDVNATADTDFTVERLVARANDTLANGFGNALNRVTTLRHRSHRTGARPDRIRPTPALDLPSAVAADLADFARREASDRIAHAIDELNQRIEADEPWKLAGEPDRAEQLTELLDRYSAELRSIAHALAPITPDLSQRALEQLDADASIAPRPVYARLDTPARSSAAPA